MSRTNTAICRHEFPCEHGLMAYREDKCRCGICVQAVTLRYAPPEERVTANGTIRRLRALNAIGYTFREMEQRMGIRLDLDLITTPPKNPTVSAGFARSVLHLYDQLSMRPLTGEQADAIRQAAAQQGWAAPLAWDDDKIEDPMAKPNGIRPLHTREPVRRGPAVVQRDNVYIPMKDLEHLIRQGVDAETLQKLMNVQKKSIIRRLNRAGRSDLAARLNQPAESYALHGSVSESAARAATCKHLYMTRK